MKNIFFALIASLLFLGCSSNATPKDVQAKLVVGQSLKDFALPDQHEKVQKLAPNTKVIFFSFAKPTGHICNEFLGSKDASYLAQHHAVYVADVSPAPSLIKTMFILPDLKKLPFPILLINDDTLSAEYSKGMDKESIVMVYLNDGTITKIENIHDAKALEAALNN